MFTINILLHVCISKTKRKKKQKVSKHSTAHSWDLMSVLLSYAGETLAPTSRGDATNQQLWEQPKQPGPATSCGSRRRKNSQYCLLPRQGAGRLQLSNIPISAGRQEIWFFGRSRILMAWNSSIYLGMIWIRVLLMCHSFRCVCSFKESGSSWNRMDPVDQN